MDFFARQDAARGTTTRLVVLFAFAVVAIVAVVDLVTIGVPFLIGSSKGSDAGDLTQGLITATVITVAIIAGGTLTKTLALRGGGAAVARSVGASPVDPTTSDPRLRRFVNVVEEMSIASGVPMPRLFVLEHEGGINAFAAGYRPADAAIAVTAGALDQLDRDELQGVIGHEFSHVLNGDMRLNIRLVGLLYGILLLGIFGLRLLPFSGQSFGRRDKKTPALAFVAIALIVVGFVGQFFARIIQAAVSRQRELLADASAVQFTRQTDGLVGALRKIAGLPAGSALADKAAENQLGHMLFGEGRARFSALFATHPPLEQRIAVLTGRPVEQVRADVAPRAVPAAAAGFAAIPPAAVTQRVATITPDDLARGTRIRERLPQDLHALAGQRSGAVPLVLALLLDARVQVGQAQLATVRGELGTAVADHAAHLAPQLAGLDRVLALPLAQLAVPQLVNRPPAEVAAVARTVGALVRADQQVSPFEYALGTLLAIQLGQGPRPRRGSAAALDGAVATVLAVVAASGNADPAAAQRAFDRAAAIALPGRRFAFRPPPGPWDALDAAWPLLLALPPNGRRQLVEAVVAAVADDGTVTLAEAELLRVTCAVLGAPLPPLLG